MKEAESPGVRRTDAIRRAEAFSPFLRDALARQPEVASCFVDEGSEAAVRLALTPADAPVDAELRRQRYALALGVALGDLSGEMPLERVTELLSDFADRALDQALAAAISERVPGATTEGFSIIAMGKLGSSELNYSSDVDLLLLFDPAKLARRERDDPSEAAVRIGRRLIEIMQKRTADGYVQRVDLRLRPSPEVTPIVLAVDAAISHYESSALPWERAAFIRARASAGDLDLGRRFLTAIEPFVWRRSLDFGVIDDVRQISSRIRAHYSKNMAVGPGFDLKRGRGGIRETEFFVQIQQMIHAGRDASLRAPATLDAIRDLHAAGHLSEDVAAQLSSAYRLLRTVEHRVQMVDDQQTHQLPGGAAALDELAQLDGLGSGEDLLALLRPHVEEVEHLFDGLGGEDDTKLAREQEPLENQLRGLGFDDPSSALQHLASWRTGRARALRSPAAQDAFEAMLPGLLQAIAAGADPDHALNRLSDIVERLSSGVNLFRMLEAQPTLSKLLAKILAHAPALADQLARRPELLDGLFDASSFAMPDSAVEFAETLTKAMADQPYDLALDRARRVVNERRFALGVQLIDHRRDPLELAVGYSRVAEGAVEALAAAALQDLEQKHGRFEHGELIILGLGRLGGCALTHASDLDLIYLHTAPADTSSDGPRPLGPNDYFNRAASRVTAALSVGTAAGPLYDVDTRLRPEGAKGMLAVSLEAFERYQRSEAWTWEHMALCRARPVFGSADARKRSSEVIESILRAPHDASKVIADAGRMRRDIAQHKPARSALDVKLGPGGLVDLEFAVHVVQLTKGLALTPNLDDAVVALATDNIIGKNVVEAQRLLTRMLVSMRLVAPLDVKPTPATWQMVAEACGANSWDDLLAVHDAARQSIAQLWERISEGRQHG